MLVAFAVTPVMLNTSSGSATLTITAHITDAQSGLSSASVLFNSPSGNQSVSASLSSSYRTSGTAQDGSYSRTLAVPQFSEQGAWQARVAVYDVLGNDSSYDAAQLTAAGFSSQFTQSGTSTDVTSPVLVAFALTPVAVNTSSASATLTLTAHLTDAQSGVSSASVLFNSPSGKQSVSASLSSSYRTSGNAQDGYYSRTLTVPQFSEQGTWLGRVAVYDVLGNDVSYEAAQLTTAGFSSQFTQSGTTTDTVPPVLVAFAVTPTTVNTSSASATLTITAHVIDALAGLSSASVLFNSPGGNQSVSCSLSSSYRTSGTAQDGYYSRTVTVPQSSEQGTWLARVALYDVLGNDVSYDAAQLAAAGFTSQIRNGP